MNAVADTLALMNMLIVPRFTEVASSRGLHILVLPETAQNISSCDDSAPFNNMKSTLEASLANGTLKVVDVRPGTNPDLYCQLVPTFNPVTARTVLLAHRHDAIFITESPKILDNLGKLASDVRSTTGLGIVKQWMTEDNWTQDDVTNFILGTILYAQPTQGHPLREWWYEHFLAAQCRLNTSAISME
jgi:hypothetical protein